MLAVAQGGDCLTQRTGQTGRCSMVFRWIGDTFQGITDSETSLAITSGGQALTSSAPQDVEFFETGAGDGSVGLVFAFFATTEIGDADLDGLYGERSEAVGSPLYLSFLRNFSDVLRGSRAIAVSHDGAHVYVAAELSRSIAVFDRDSSSGLLDYSPSSTYFSSEVGTITSLVVTETLTGSCLYATSAFPGDVLVFTRDGTTGSLTKLQSVLDDAPDQVVGALLGARNMLLSPGGGELYVAAYVDAAVAEFNRSFVDGRLEFLDRLKDGERLLVRFYEAQRQLFEDEAATEGLAFFDGEVFEVEGNTYLATASGTSGTRMYMWNVDMQKFRFLHRLSWANGTTADPFDYDHAAYDVEYSHSTDAVSGDTVHLLIVSNAYSFVDDIQYRNIPVPCTVYWWSSSAGRFVFLEHLDNTGEDIAGKKKFAAKLKTFTMGRELYVAVAYTGEIGSYDVSSTLYRWDSSLSSFGIHQQFPTSAAMDVAHIRSFENDFIVFASWFSSGQVYSGPLSQGGAQGDVFPSDSNDTIVYIYDNSTALFVELQRIPTSGAYGIETFTISEEIGATGVQVPRIFLAIANKQAVAPSPDGDLTIFDQESQLYEWFGGQFVPYQGLSQENTPAEDECRFNE
eukprot:349676-Rhodomonas_salina.1